MAKIKINSEIRDIVQNQGKTFNEAIMQKYEGEIHDLRNKYENLKDCSPTKLAMISAGITGNDIMNALFKTEDNEFLYPAYTADLIDKTIYKSDVLSYLINGESGTSSRTVEVPIIDLLSATNAKKSRTARVAEGAETSYRTLEIEEATFKLNKKMIGSKITYEAMREMKIDLWSRIVTAIATDITRQNVQDVIKTIQSADSTALLTTATADTITNDEFVKATTEFLEIFGTAPEIMVVGKEMYESVAKMNYSSTDTFGVNSRFTLSLPQLEIAPITIIKGDTMAKEGGKNVARLYTKATAPQRWLQTGSSLTEYDTNTLNQTQTVVISEISGYSNFVKQYGVITSA